MLLFWSQDILKYLAIKFVYFIFSIIHVKKTILYIYFFIHVLVLSLVPYEYKGAQ